MKKFKKAQTVSKNNQIQFDFRLIFSKKNCELQYQATIRIEMEIV